MPTNVAGRMSFENVLYAANTVEVIPALSATYMFARNALLENQIQPQISDLFNNSLKP
jgi:hypothetical protein